MVELVWYSDNKFCFISAIEYHCHPPKSKWWKCINIVSIGMKIEIIWFNVCIFSENIFIKQIRVYISLQYGYL